MKKGQINEESLKTVLTALSSVNFNVHKGEPSLLTNEVVKVIDGIKNRKGNKRSAFAVLIKDKITEEMISSILSFDEKQPTNEDHQDYLIDLYMNNDLYEESVNRIVEELEGGMFSYDKTYHILDAYEKELRSGISMLESYCGVPLSYWVNYCISLVGLTKYGAAEAFIDARSKVLETGKDAGFVPVLNFDDAKVGDILFNSEEDITIVVENKTDNSIALMQRNSNGSCNGFNCDETTFYQLLKEVQSLGEYKMIDARKGGLL